MKQASIFIPGTAQSDLYIQMPLTWDAYFQEISILAISSSNMIQKCSEISSFLMGAPVFFDNIEKKYILPSDFRNVDILDKLHSSEYKKADIDDLYQTLFSVYNLLDFYSLNPIKNIMDKYPIDSHSLSKNALTFIYNSPQENHTKYNQDTFLNYSSAWATFSKPRKNNITLTSNNDIDIFDILSKNILQEKKLAEIVFDFTEKYDLFFKDNQFLINLTFENLKEKKTCNLICPLILVIALSNSWSGNKLNYYLNNHITDKDKKNMTDFLNYCQIKEINFTLLFNGEQNQFLNKLITSYESKELGKSIEYAILSKRKKI